MDEDKARLENLTISFTEAIIKAFKLRFPEKTPDSITITINSLLSSLVSYMLTIEPSMRFDIAEAIIDTMIEVQNEP